MKKNKQIMDELAEAKKNIAGAISKGYSESLLEKIREKIRTLEEKLKNAEK